MAKNRANIGKSMENSPWSAQNAAPKKPPRFFGQWYAAALRAAADPAPRDGGAFCVAGARNPVDV